MFSTDAVAAALAATMLILAGCTGAVPGGSGGGTGSPGPAAGSGTVTLYVSDQPGAMGDFDHLNVTIDRVAYHQVNASDGSADGSDNQSDGTETRVDTADGGGENETAEPGDGPASDAGWHTYDIDDPTVDLTELQGENATTVGQQRLPNGTYDRVVLYVSDVNGTLADGNATRVKLPSGKLQVQKRFAVGANESLNFVFDATVVKAGGSGKYVLTPVVSESGTDVPIREVEHDGASGLGARFVGDVAPGEAATVTVTRHGQPVTGASVEINGRTYQTGGDGTVMFDVPADADAVEVTVQYADGEVELTRTVPARGDGDGGAGHGEDNRRGGSENAGENGGEEGNSDGAPGDGGEAADDHDS